MMMKRRFRRRSRTHADDGAIREHSKIERSPFNLLWIIFGVVVLAAVIFYDQRLVQQARHDIDQARYFQQQGLYSEALKQYQHAYKNKRLGRRQKGEVALAIGDIYFDQFENYDMAHNYFVRAKQDNPKLYENSNAQERLKAASQKTAGSGITKGNTDGTTSTIIQRVQLVSAPAEDQRGPVVAQYKGATIRAGEFLRFLRGRPEFMDPHFRDDPRKLEDLLKQYLSRTLRYQAALDADIQKDPDVSARLYEYQRTLIAERYAVEIRQNAQTVTTAQVQDYYDKNKGQYVQPASATIAMIKTQTESEAQQALDRLHKGDLFADVATSMSIDEQSAKRQGTVGIITENDTEIPGVGAAAEIIKELIRLRPNSVTGITPANGAFFVFHILRNAPQRITTMDEARPEIETKLRGTSFDDATRNFDQSLRERYQPDVSLDGLQKFWQFAVSENAATSASNKSTSGSTTTDHAATTTTTTHAEAGAERGL